MTQRQQPSTAPISTGFDKNPAQSFSLHADAYTQSKWFAADKQNIIGRSWQWVCHVEKTRKPGSFTTAEIAGQPIAVVRDKTGALRAFYNVCKHRAHQLLSGEGQTSLIVCPYHAWAYKLDGQLQGAPHTQNLTQFNKDEICLDQIQVEEFCGFVFINLDPNAASLAKQSGNLEAEIMHWAPDVADLTFGCRLSLSLIHI